MEREQGHVVEYAVLLRVWAALLVLTALLLAASRLSPALAVLALLTLTPLKAWLVLYFFMHLRYEGLLLKGMVLTALSTLLVFIGMLFLDIGFR
ncbi:MAG TPA: cytochrome-c oxidase [Elusimicrobia bacterium]|nr:cytochrome-c oxidase [Elusimicrobiota bacterium]